MRFRKTIFLIIAILLLIFSLACSNNSNDKNELVANDELLEEEDPIDRDTSDELEKEDEDEKEDVKIANEDKEESLDDKDNENSRDKVEKEDIEDKKEKENKEEVSKDKEKDQTNETQGSEVKENSDDTIENEPIVTEASGTFYVRSNKLNIRSGDGTNYNVLGSLSKNSKIDVTGKTSRGWYRIDYKGKKAYVSGNYLSKDQVKDEISNNNSQPSNSKNLVDKMKNLGISQQVILVTTKGSNTSRGQVRTFEKGSDGKWNQVLEAPAHIGKNGFTSNKREGDGKTPIGKYSIGHAFGYQGNPGTKLSFKASTPNDVWVDDPNSKYYNTWQKDKLEDKDWNSAETMMHPLYNYGFVINYNTGQTPNAGSAIFFHVGSSHTLGCVATSQGKLINILKWLDPGKSPVIIQTPESGLGNY